MNAWYFGTWGQAGHYWFLPVATRAVAPRSVHLPGRGAGAPEGYPWEGVDGVHTPRGTRREHLGALHHRDGWTVLSVHDYTVDSRPGSHSTFVFDEHLDFDEALAAATEWFPQVVERVGSICPEPG